MSKYRVIDTENWDRKEQFQFFRDYDNPFFGLTTNLDVTKLLAYTQANNYSFFAAYLFASQQQIHSIPEFRYRIEGNKVVEYSEVAAGSTVLKENDVFTFCYFDHYSSFQDYNAHVIEQINQCRKPNSQLIDHDDDLAQIHYSVIPWVHFTGLTHPRNYKTDDSIPKIVFGKYEQQAKKFMMPISVEAHHALLDGFHMGLYFKRFQECIDDPKTLLEG